MTPVIIITVFLVLPQTLNGISTTHHDKSDEAKISLTNMSKEMPEEEKKDMNSTDVTERQRRLIPYMTFYLSHNYNQPQVQQQKQQPEYQYIPQKIQVQPVYHNKYIVPNYSPKYTIPSTSIIYRPKITYTPFLESNKLPGHFNPMSRGPTIQIQENQPQYHTHVANEPNFSSIFDKLLQMKQLQNKLPQYNTVPQYQSNPKVNIAADYYTRNYITRRPPTKYISVEDYQIAEQNYKPIPSHVKTIIHTYTPASIDVPTDSKNHYNNFESLKVYDETASIKIPQKSIPQVQSEENYKQILVQDIPEKNYETYILRPISKHKQNAVTYRPVYHPLQFNIPKTTPQPIYHQPTENPNSLSVILKQLQESNTLPHTLTPDNIDNSIKTLVHILNSLKNTKLQRPIVVDDVSEEDDNIHEEEPEVPINDNYYINTPEGGTPGKAGQDYPAYSKIPTTQFNCKTQRYKGFFGDPETNCQVWHYCDLNGGQASFLCPNGTIFSQVALTCDWWYNVKCATTTQLYVLNERLYKYILPFTPKFPEDYSGPLVDKYLALKFKEMEEKMRKQKKGKIPKPADDTREGDVNNLQIIEAETITKPHTTEPSE